MSPSTFQCRVCNSRRGREFQDYPALARVTSDGRVWPAGGRLCGCEDCGAVQKPGDEKWIGEIDRIYTSYALYHQSDGKEQPIFRPGHAPRPRSELLAEFLGRHFPDEGSIDLLDFGCGVGAALKTFSRMHPGWGLYGSELSDMNRDLLMKIPQFVTLYTQPPDAIPRRFDLITLIHVLEHVLEPVGILKALSGRLKDNGMMFVQVPDCRQTPYDLLIADHATHFTKDTLRLAVERAGVSSAVLSDAVLPKELTWLGGNGGGAAAADAGPPPEDDLALTVRRLAWLAGQVAEAKDIADRSAGFGVFGTSISGTWLAGAIGDKVAFFVDEDPDRIGKSHMGRPVVAPGAVASGSDVYLALIPGVAAKVGERLARPGVAYHNPPPL